MAMAMAVSSSSLQLLHRPTQVTRILTQRFAPSTHSGIYFLFATRQTPLNLATESINIGFEIKGLNNTLPTGRLAFKRKIKGLNNTLPMVRLGFKRNVNKLLVRATENDQSEESDRQRLEELEARLGLQRKSRREGLSVEAPPPPRPKMPAKPWDDMSLPEKAWDLYIGEKGALFWLNKLAYASIYLIIGGWIVFRFIGPALGWYELDSGLLPPSQVLAGTAGR